ncbi:MAG: hypothetical protein WC309_02620 [Candidatus Paceibacterota bacterium]|jgi:hypothetical protein
MRTRLLIAFEWWKKNKFIFERWRSNVGIGQFIMTVFIAVANGFPIWLLIIFIVLSILYTIKYDIPRIYPQETSDGFANNPLNMEMLNILREWKNEKDKAGLQNSKADEINNSPF